MKNDWAGRTATFQFLAESRLISDGGLVWETFPIPAKLTKK
jgi:hypothetical protein